MNSLCSKMQNIFLCMRHCSLSLLLHHMTPVGKEYNYVQISCNTIT